MNGKIGTPPVIAPPVVAESAPAGMPVATGRRKRRWWLYGLGTLGGLFVLGLAAIVGLGIYWKSLVQRYTATMPQPIPQFVASPDELEALGTRFQQFREALKGRQSVRPFQLSTRDLNLLLAQNSQLKDRVYLQITNNQLTGQFSLPLDQTGRKELRGRHLNGTVTLAVGLQDDGFLMLKITSVKMNGKAPPGWINRKLMGKNLLDDLNNQRATLELLPALESVNIQDDLLTITPINR